jgi:hypothetical protein
MIEFSKKLKDKIWLISVDMGYGHQRTAYPLRHMAFGSRFISANNYLGIPKKDKKIWEASKKGYDFISAFSRVPIIGNIVFSIFDKFQEISSFYPARDLSKPTFQLRQNYNLIKKGWGKDLIERIKEKPLPLITTFFTPAFMAEYFDYPEEIYCVIPDTDISRSWVALNPKKSRIKYLAPNSRVVERLQLYGVDPDNIYLTGYPLPLENIGGENMEVLKKDLKDRLLNLDPQKSYFQTYNKMILNELGELPPSSGRPLTLMFAVGGAGAQKEIGIRIVENLSDKLIAGEIKIILVAGIKETVRDYFVQNLKKLGLNKKVEVIFSQDINSYFEKFNKALNKTDILWTKPSELSFYSALGLPILIAPPIGSQERFNKRWLLKSGFGLAQGDPAHIKQWLFDWLDKGYFAEIAMESYMEGKQLGTIIIEKVCCG